MKKIIVIAVLLMLVASAAGATNWPSILTGTLGNVNVNATATLTGGVWDYVYVVSPTDFPALAGTMHSFSIGNPGDWAYYAVTTSDAALSWVGYLPNTIRWAGTLPAASPITFSFKSIYAPALVDCSAQNGGHASVGNTLGMAVPEPMSMILGGLGLVSVGGFKRLRRK
ncbi:MAG: hypothetical protein ACYC64_09035 [Armatimonadota bacterium]